MPVRKVPIGSVASRPLLGDWLLCLPFKDKRYVSTSRGEWEVVSLWAYSATRRWREGVEGVEMEMLAARVGYLRLIACIRTDTSTDGGLRQVGSFLLMNPKHQYSIRFFVCSIR